MKSLFNDFDTCVYDKKNDTRVCFWPCSCLTHKKNTGSRIYLHIYSYKADIGILLKYRGAFEVRRRIW